jgi:hypothetical protein
MKPTLQHYILVTALVLTFILYEIEKQNTLCISLTSLETSAKKNHSLCTLPDWVNKSPWYLAEVMMNSSLGLTDKVDTKNHEYQFLYFPYMSSMVRDRYCNTKSQGDSNQVHVLSQRPKIRLLEIGLGCAPTGGMIRGQPGGSALAWRHLFGNQTDDFELHIMEFDGPCAEKWAASHKDIAIVHVGDASSEVDLKRVVDAASPDGDSTPFDIIIDDASHINWHQIKTLETLIPALRPGGFYVIEDIHSSCVSWKANLGTNITIESPQVGGTYDCMTTQSGEPTIYAKVVEWQKALLRRQEPFKGVNHIDLHKEAVLLEKRVY